MAERCHKWMCSPRNSANFINYVYPILKPSLRSTQSRYLDPVAIKDVQMHEVRPGSQRPSRLRGQHREVARQHRGPHAHRRRVHRRLDHHHGTPRQEAKARAAQGSQAEQNGPTVPWAQPAMAVEGLGSGWSWRYVQNYSNEAELMFKIGCELGTSKSRKEALDPRPWHGHTADLKSSEFSAFRCS